MSTRESIRLLKDGYAAMKASPGGPLTVSSPALFSPAAMAQDEGTGSTGVARFGPMYLPLEFGHWSEEAVAHVRSCYLGDWSSLSKTLIRGPQALEFLGVLGMNDLTRFEVGQIKHHVQLDDDGRVAMEGILLRCGVDEFQFTAGSGAWLIWQAGRGSWDLELEDVSVDRFIFGVQGPRSLAVMERIVGETLRDISFNRSRPARIGDVEVRVLRTGISGELGYEIHGPASSADDVWRRVVEAGADDGIRQLGFRVQSVQHVESGIATNGLDYMPSSGVTPGAPWQFKRGYPGGSFVADDFAEYFRMPGELGWGARGPLERDFIGAAALRAEQERGGPARVFTGLAWDTDDVAGVFRDVLSGRTDVEPMELPKVQGPVFDQILVDGALVGVSSGRTLSATVGGTISLCCLDRELAAPGTAVTVLWGRSGTEQRPIRATVTRLPFKPDRRRVDVSVL